MPPAVRFRDPAPPIDRAREIRAAIARVLVNAPAVPVELPVFGLVLDDVQAETDTFTLILREPGGDADYKLDIRWDGEGVDAKGYDAATGNCIVSVDPRYFRPTEVETLLGDPTKAREKLGWEPTVPFDELVGDMMRSDLAEAERDALCAREGYRVLERNE